MKLFYLLIILFSLPLVTAVDYPELKDFVTDNADIISPEYEAQITQLAKQIEQETTTEIAIVTIQSLEGISKENYALELAEKNGIGKEDVDNGLLILIALDERAYRVEVGYGLEGLIPDSSKVTLGTRILEPNFREGDFGKGIYDSLLAVQGLLQGEEEVLSQYQSSYSSSSSSFQLWFYLIFFVIIILSSVLGRKAGRRSGFMFMPIIIPGNRGFSGGTGGFGSSGFGGGSFGGGGFGGGW
ncbi:hypothetical protein CL617_03035 [archaeon]|nr:hypothetical protein [archaeon]|tara:strand:- start:16383 stop:17108 length:726 start_codon:yes stop_codon:yes gene_type:complete